MRIHHLLRMIAAPALVFVASTPFFAQEKSWTGESVLPKKHTEDIQFGYSLDGKQVFFPLSDTLNLQVRDDREGWLRIHDGRREGWADKADFVLGRDAPAYFHRRVQANPKDSWALYMRGVGWSRKGEPDNAIQDFNEYIRLNPTSSAAYTVRGNAWSDKKEYDRAIKDYDEAIRLDPAEATPVYNRGIAWSDKKEYDRAIKDYDEAIRLDPKYVNAFNNRGNAWRDKKEYDRAIKDYDEAIRLDLKYPLAQFNRAVTQMLVRRSDAALDGFRTVFELQGWKGAFSPYSVILGNLASRQVGDDAGAKRFLNDSAGKLIEAWPYPVVRFLRGEIDESALLKLAVDNDKRTEAHCFLGLDYLVKGRREESLAQFTWVKDHGNVTFSEYTIAVAELDRLKKMPE